MTQHRTRAGSRCSPDDGSSAGPDWENSVRLSEPMDFRAIERFMPDLDGEFWDAMRWGVAKMARELALDLLKQFMALPPEDVKAFFMRVSEGKSYREIGRELGIHHATVKAKVERVALHLKHEAGRLTTG